MPKCEVILGRVSSPWILGEWCGSGGNHKMQFRDLFLDPEVGFRLAEHMPDCFLVFDRKGTLLDANRKIFEHSNDAILVVDPENDAILDANPQACLILGYTYGELRSIPISDIHPHKMPEFLSFAHSVLEVGTGWTHELSCRTKSGVVLPAEISASLLEIDDRLAVLALVRSLGEGDMKDPRPQGQTS